MLRLLVNGGTPVEDVITLFESALKCFSSFFTFPFGRVPLLGYFQRPFCRSLPQIPLVSLTGERNIPHPISSREKSFVVKNRKLLGAVHSMGQLVVRAHHQRT